MRQNVYLLSSTPEGGIWHCGFEEGALWQTGFTPLDRPMFAASRSDKLYITFHGDDEAEAAAFLIGANGDLTPLGIPQPVGGACACHTAVSPDGQWLFTANYMSGSVSMLPIFEDGSLGSVRQVIVHCGHGTHSTRQQSAHAHGVFVTPDEEYLAVCDLGLDQVLFYQITESGLHRHSICQLPAGDGVRHLVFAGDYAYCVNELNPAVTVLRYENGAARVLSRHPVLPEGYGAAIKINQAANQLYVTSRGENAICCFDVASDQLSAPKTLPCGGNWPRDFSLSPDEKWLLSANERSNNISILPLQQGIVRQSTTTFFIPTPMQALLV